VREEVLSFDWEMLYFPPSDCLNESRNLSIRKGENIYKQQNNISNDNKKEKPRTWSEE